MPWLSWKRLLTPKRVWKVFTSKLLLKLQKSKAIKLPRKRYLKPAKKHGWKPLSIQPKKFKIQHNPKRLIHHQTTHCYFQKGAGPVVVNQLYIDPTVNVVKAHVDPPNVAVERGDDAQRTRSTNSATTVIVYEGSNCSESNKGGKSKEDDHTLVSPDDMWETVMASPQMNGINERAEEFIARFRAEMHRQEIQARHLQ